MIDFSSFIPWDQIRPHAENVREMAIRYADGILDRLDAISDAVSNPATIETTKTLPFGFLGAGDTSVFSIPSGEQWRLNYAVQFSPVANARILMRESNSGGRLLWGFLNSPDVPGYGSTGLELVGPMDIWLISEWAGDNPVELTLQFTVSRPGPKSRTRKVGLWEQLPQNLEANNDMQNTVRHLNYGGMNAAQE